MPPADLIKDLAIILGLAAVITFVFRRIKQPVVLGYITAGIIVGPFIPSILSVADTKSIKVWAELGVIFLMFTLGLEFSFRRLANASVTSFVSAGIEIPSMILIGVLGGNFLGYNWINTVFLGCMVAISSTTIILKTLDELNLKTKKFAELVFGILIVEDLVAILMLVAVTNIAQTSEIAPITLLLAGGKLLLVVCAWFVFGMFVIPRIITSMSKHGSDEMLTVMSIGLCLLFVLVAEYFNYSPALGAFITGSIIAESIEAKKIEQLVTPLKDLFGAVFFVSVGMLLDPYAIYNNLPHVLLVSLLIVFGKILAVSLGAFLSGQSVINAIQAACSMAQIGEFSFIIAAVGAEYKVIAPDIFPIIVAASLLTTFTTPYLVRISPILGLRFERLFPPRIRVIIENYGSWLQRQTTANKVHRDFTKMLAKWILNAIIITVLFTISFEYLLPLLAVLIGQSLLTHGLAWVVAFILATPSIYALFSVFPAKSGVLLISRAAAIILIGLMSIQYFPASISLSLTAVICGFLFMFFRSQIGGYYSYIETQFKSGFKADLHGHNQLHAHLAPWDAHLVEIRVPAGSFLAGKSLLQLELREKYGLNVVVIIRDKEQIVAPKSLEIIYPQDLILCFATDTEIERFKRDIYVGNKSSKSQNKSFSLHRIKALIDSKFLGQSLRDIGVHEKFGCIVVGLERNQERIRSPKSDTEVRLDDVLWVVGDSADIETLAQEFCT